MFTIICLFLGCYFNLPHFFLWSSIVSDKIELMRLCGVLQSNFSYLSQSESRTQLCHVRIHFIASAIYTESYREHRYISKISVNTVVRLIPVTPTITMQPRESPVTNPVIVCQRLFGVCLRMMLSMTMPPSTTIF